MEIHVAQPVTSPTGILKLFGLTIVFAINAANTSGQDSEFAPAPAVTTGLAGSKSVEVGDIDGDGDADLLVATGLNGSIVWYESDGNTNPSYPVSHLIDNNILDAAHASLVDLDGDGDLDIIAAVRASASVAVWYENVGGLPPVFVARTLGTIGPNNIGNRVNAARAGDLDGDGDLDVVVSYYVNQLAAQGHVAWYRNNGGPTPSFTANLIPNASGTLENVSDIRLADLDGNGSLDIAAVSETPATSQGRNRVVWWSSSGGANPTFQYNSIDTGLVDPVSIDVADFTGNSALDLAVAASGSGRVVIFQSTGGPTPTFGTSASEMLSEPRSVRAMDMDDDGDTDLVVSLRSGSDLVLLENQGTPGPSFLNRSLGASGGASEDAAVGDLSGDGRPDVAAIFPVTGRLDWFEQVRPIINLNSGNEHATFQDAVASASTGHTLRIPAERLRNDPSIDTAGKGLALLSDADFSLGEDAVVRFDNGTTLVAPTGFDVDLRGTLEVAAGSTVSVFAEQQTLLADSLALTGGSDINIGSDLLISGPRTPNRVVIDGDEFLGTFPNLIGRPIQSLPIKLATGDVGFIVSGQESGGPGSGNPAAIAVYAPDPNAANGWTGYAVDNNALATHGPIATGDINGDGVEDLVSIRTITGVPQLRVHYAQQTQTPLFTSSTVATGIDAQHLATADLDYDGDIDIVTGQGWFRSSGGATPIFTFTPFPVVAAAQSFGLIVCDFDLDGGRDIAIHCEKLSQNSAGRVGYQLYVLHSDASNSPSFTPILIQERDFVLNGTCSGDVDCYPIANIELDGLNTLSRADANMDSLTDLFFSDDDGITLFLNQSTTVPAFTSVSVSTDYVFDELFPVDIDSDHDIDLIASSMRTSRVRFLQNNGSGFTESRSLKPILRASGASVLATDNAGLKRLAVIGTGFDRVEVVDFNEFPRLDVINSNVDVLGLSRVGSGELVVSGGQFAANGDLYIGPRGLLAGEGIITGSVFNSGIVRPRRDLSISGDFTQNTPQFPEIAGELRIEMQTSMPVAHDRLLIGGEAALRGVLNVTARETFTPDASDTFDVVLAGDLNNTLNRFDVVQLPRLSVIDSGKPVMGTLFPSYGDTPPSAVVKLVPVPMEDPMLGNRPFTALGTPADAVVKDFTGGPNGEPDGFADTVIAYPVIPGGPEMGGVAVFTGSPSQNSEYDFESLAIYTGQLAAKPIAVEAGDYDGDDRLEIAVGNSLTDSNQTLVFLLEVDSSSATPLVPSQVPPLLTRRGARTLDLATGDFMPGSQRTPSIAHVGSPVGLVVLTDIENSGVATVAVFAGPGWDSCDVDVCDDPDSVDPIDVDGIGGTLIDGYCATSNGDNKVTIAANPASSPGMFVTLMVDVGDGPTELRADDLNNDGFPDIAVVNESDGTVSILLNISDAAGPGGRGFTEQLVLDLRADADDPAPLPSSVALADLDDDGDLDVAVVSTNEAGVRAVRRLDNQFIETGELAFASAVDFEMQPDGVPLFVREADLDGDGLGVMFTDDLVVYVEPSGALRTPEFGPAGHVAVSSNGTDCLADTNGDGMLTPADFTAWIAAFNANAPACDQNGDGLCSPGDFTAWIANYNAGCP